METVYNADSTIREAGLGNNVEILTDDRTVVAKDEGKHFQIATDAKLITLADECPLGMKIVIENTGADGAVLLAVVGSSTVGIGGWTNNLAGTRSLLTSGVAKELRNTKSTALQYDYVELVKVSATKWNSKSFGIWVKEA